MNDSNVAVSLCASEAGAILQPAPVRLGLVGA